MCDSRESFGSVFTRKILEDFKLEATENNQKIANKLVNDLIEVIADNINRTILNEQLHRSYDENKS